MNDKPILFNADMVRALLEGRKTQTRRIIKLEGEQPTEFNDNGWPIAYFERIDEYDDMPCPYGEPGDYLWVREKMALIGGFYPNDTYLSYIDEIQPDGNFDGAGNPVIKWKPAIHMKRVYSRLTLLIKDIRVERVQDISEVDAKAEGADRGTLKILDIYIRGGGTYRCGFANLWQSINGNWLENPWVWVIDFEVIKANIDKVLQSSRAKT